MDRFSSAHTLGASPRKRCIFCEIAAGRAPAEVVREDEATIAFLDRSPLVLGHVLLVPRAHVPTLPEADDATAAALILAVRDICAALPAALDCDGSFVAANNVVSQSVPHLHFHLVPRSRGDRLFSQNLVWRRVRYGSEAKMAETAARIRAALEREHG
jgi:histidine triad (HIT) family protein